MSDPRGLGDPGTAGDPALPPPPDDSLLNDFLAARALAAHAGIAARLDAFAAAHDAATAAQPAKESDPAVPGSTSPDVAPPAASPEQNPDLAAGDTIPLGLKLQLGQLGSTAWNLTKQAIAPEVGAYQNFVVRPFETTLRAVAQTPLGDPGFYASMEGLPGLQLIGGAGTEIAAGLRWLTRVGPDARELAAHAQKIHDLLHPIARRLRTTVTLQTDDGKIVAGGTRDLTPAQRDLLGPGEVPAALPRAHAEVTALAGAKAAGFRPRALASTRDICPECEAAIEANGGWLTSRRTAVFGDEDPSTDLAGAKGDPDD